ncbi:MarR family transcriptional regulator [Paenibacillus pinisoli]|uniref:MarR family transcriptional regulator n=1 Tax=Paenibacillus pinisoli TaxID=1276110 RepID=A0A3A6PVH7_9BACL|nr:MarR family transcriptional regulator [Paenibacillus pinisoli]RJX39523.1 MarR family transcriptional regulator [Paenibacillus pinisoli]
MEHECGTSPDKRDERLALLIWYRFSRIYNQSVRESEQHLKTWDMTVAQFDVIAQIGLNKRLTQGQLAEKLLVTKGNITQLLSRLEQAGLIRREQDWKVKHVSLTDKGKALYEQVVPMQERFQASHFDALDREEKEQFLHLLKKLSARTTE